MEAEKRKPDLIAYQVSRSGRGESVRTYYHRIGAAWTNSKGGAKVKLDAFPLSGEVLLLPPRENEDFPA